MQRHDDAAEVVTKRLDEYDEKTAPLIEHYEKHGDFVHVERPRRDRRRHARDHREAARRRSRDRERTVITIKSAREIELMRVSGKITAKTLIDADEDASRPGMTTADLDKLAEESIRAMGGMPTFIGYHGFKHSICASVNEEVVHGIPGPRVLDDGDLLSIDIGTTLEGYVSDTAVTIPIGNGLRRRAERLMTSPKSA